MTNVVALPQSEPDVFYRYEDVRYAAPLDEYGNPIGYGRLEVICREYRVTKRTSKGVWISLGFGDKRFVLNDATKRYALPTIEMARESFIARKKRQISIHQATVNRAREAIELIGGGNERCAVLSLID